MRDTAAMLSRPVRALIVGLIACALTGAIVATGVLDGLERIALDARYDVRGSDGAPDDVVVVEIDGATVDRFGFPFDRRLHARAIEALSDGGAGGDAYDVPVS